MVGFLSAAVVLGFIAYLIIAAVLELNDEKSFSRNVEKYLKENDGNR